MYVYIVRDIKPLENSMVDKCMTLAEVDSILATSRPCGNIHYSYQHYQPGKKTLHFFVLMIVYLVAISYELWMK